MLFPADLKQWLPDDDLVYFLIDVVDELDLGSIACQGKSFRSKRRRYGNGNRGNQLPKELRLRQSRLKKIRDAKKVIAHEAAVDIKRQQEAYKKNLIAKKQRDDRRGRPPKAPSEEPEPNHQYIFTDLDSRIMMNSATKSFQQGYSCQSALFLGRKP